MKGTVTDIFKRLLLFLFFITASPILMAQQRIAFGIHADPLISWFSSDNNLVKNDGSRPGFNFGLSCYKYFSPNYSFSTGISIITASGRLVNSDTTILKLSGLLYKVLPNKTVIYKIQYLAFPLGLKLQTNQIGYVTYFTDLGLDPKILIGRKADIPSLNVTNQKASEELRLFNLSYHVTAGVEYSLGGNTALVFGLNYDNNFIDITKDRGTKLSDKISHKMLSFRLGVNF